MTNNISIEPRYESFSVTTEWKQEDSLRWWGKEIQVSIEDVTQDGLLRKKRYGSSVGEVFYLLVCSPEFKKTPNTEVDKEDIAKALVLEEFSPEVVEDYLKKRVDGIGPIDLEGFDKHMREVFDMSDWDDLEEVLPVPKD